MTFRRQSPPKNMTRRVVMYRPGTGLLRTDARVFGVRGHPLAELYAASSSSTLFTPEMKSTAFCARDAAETRRLGDCLMVLSQFWR